MTRIKTAALVAAMALLMVASFALGSAMTQTAAAQEPSRAIGNGDITAVPDGEGGWIVWDPDANNLSHVPADAAADDIEPVVCSMVEGCDIPVVFETEEGEVAKTIVIRMEDPAVTATPTPTPE